ncbi:glycosyltransferase family 4 protein [Sporolactobacillus sp. CPB3-1]|uniref:Glycosyltransferase family 4 protein n=1 Tax=Sporolactobacillus mangiferae TaxID=2940498 RepID=A0ABT0M8W1_9BACL|nr:glycosyltransferase family 4 protein [Sporolactobacillus mangiferae]MCL1631312.1 glycosyltransferase family 4 protein [Sporolactobacillus mangiferae]
MKLALICTEKLPSPAIRGGAVQTMIDGVTPFLAKQHDLTIFSITDPLLPNRETRNTVHYIRFPSEHYGEDVASELKRHTFDVIHVFNRPNQIANYRKSAPESGFVLGLHNEMLSKKKISDVHGLEAVRAADQIVTISGYIKKTVLDRFPEAASKIQVVYSGVALNRFMPAWTRRGAEIRQYTRQKYGIRHGKAILFVGRLSRSKGPHILIDAMKQLVRLHPDTTLVIVGGKWFSDDRINPYVRALYERAEPLGDHVLFTKYVPAEQIPELFSAADVFVCSSQWQEPLARVHYEAMAAGVPIITTNRGGNAEVIQNMENGLLIDDYQNVNAFVQSIDFLLNDRRTADTLARRGREYVAAHHRFDQVAERLDRVYHRVRSSHSDTESAASAQNDTDPDSVMNTGAGA